MWRNRLGRISSAKSLDKQTTKQITTTFRGGKSVSKVATIYYLKCPIFNKKLQDMQKIGKCDPYTGKKVGNENCL